MVPIPAGDDIIAFGALLRKNFSQHGKLFGAHSASGIVCRHVRINKYQLMPITCGVSRDHETAVKVKEFCKERLVNGIASARALCSCDVGESHETRVHTSVKFRNRVRKKTGMEILREIGSILREL